VPTLTERRGLSYGPGTTLISRRCRTYRKGDRQGHNQIEMQLLRNSSNVLEKNIHMIYGVMNASSWSCVNEALQ
jgi:hypothetical protein